MFIKVKNLGMFRAPMRFTIKKLILTEKLLEFIKIPTTIKVILFIEKINNEANYE